LRLRTRLLLSLAYVALLAIVALEIPLALSLRDRVDAEVRSQAESQAHLVAASAEDLLTPRARAQLQPLVAEAARTARGRVIVVDARARLLADSSGGTIGTAYANRPELAAALRGQTHQGIRHSSSVRTDLLATAVPILSNNHVVGVVRITQSVGAVHRAVRRTIFELVLIGAAVLVVALAFAALIAGQIARPLRRLERAAREVAEGDTGARAPEDGSLEQRSLARSFNEMTERLVELLAAQRRFVADASHQLRTPLTGLRLRLEAASSGWPPSAPRDDLDAALAEVERMALVVDDLLELSRAGEVSASVHACDLAEAARDVVARFRGEAGRRGVAIRAQSAEGGAVGWCVEAELERALDALVENALAHGGGDVEVHAAGGLIEVRDRGPGPAPGEEELLFERFHRGRGPQSGGTGLGLPIARALARSWGGDATLRARAGGGAVAALIVPSHGPRTVARDTRVEVPA